MVIGEGTRRDLHDPMRFSSGHFRDTGKAAMVNEILDLGRMDDT